jgi:hypothetical protein
MGKDVIVRYFKSSRIGREVIMSGVGSIDIDDKGVRFGSIHGGYSWIDRTTIEHIRVLGPTTNVDRVKDHIIDEV